MWDKGVERRVLTFDCLCILMVIRDALSSTRCWLNVQRYYFEVLKWESQHSEHFGCVCSAGQGQINPCCTVLWWPAQRQAEMPWASFGKRENLGVFWNKSGFVKRRVYRAVPAVTSGMCPSQKGTQAPVLYRLKRIKACWDESLKVKIWLLNIGHEGNCMWRQS